MRNYIYFFIAATILLLTGRRHWRYSEPLDDTILLRMFLGFIVLTVLALTLVSLNWWSENYLKTRELKAKILGYKMYLKTTEKYKIFKDEDTKKELLPYFMIFDLNYEDLIDYANKIDKEYFCRSK